MPATSAKPVIGFVPANRGFFSDDLARQMRTATIRTLEAAGAEVVVPSEQDTKIGCVETVDEARIAGRTFRERRVDGIVVNCVNFGDEKGLAVAVREAERPVPILAFGCREEEVLTPQTPRRDSFCGLLSACEALRQIDRPYSVPEVPICHPADASLLASVQRFLGVVRVVGGLRRARYGQIGARPNDFWTCRYSEKALQRLGPTVVTLDLSEVFGRMCAMDADARVREIVTELQTQMDCSAVAEETLVKIAKLERVLRQFIEAEHLDAVAVQCWTSIQENMGLSACTVMSRLDDAGISAACEADVLGALSMHALQLAGGGPSCLADWNNLHNEDPELVNCWHCGVFPMSWAQGKPRMGCHEIVGDATGRDNAMGVAEFVMQNGPVTLCRATHDADGRPKAVLAQGAVEPNAAETFGSYGWVRLPQLAALYREVLLRHFPHHVAMTRSHVGNVLWEALGNYLGFELYTPDRRAGGSWTPSLPFPTDGDERA